eukprot:SAG25_NODE_4445_length_814_cov_1.706294_1_plen_261_part_10
MGKKTKRPTQMQPPSMVAGTSDAPLIVNKHTSCSLVPKTTEQNSHHFANVANAAAAMQHHSTIQAFRKPRQNPAECEESWVVGGRLATKMWKVLLSCNTRGQRCIRYVLCGVFSQHTTRKDHSACNPITAVQPTFSLSDNIHNTMVGSDLCVTTATMTTTVMITSAISMHSNSNTGVTARLVEGRHRHVRQRAAALLPAALRELVAVDVALVPPPRRRRPRRPPPASTGTTRARPACSYQEHGDVVVLRSPELVERLREST